VRYHSSGAFRRALEDRLRSQSLALGLPLIRLRKMVTFERFVARLTAAEPGYWLLKGGLALQWRLGNLARTTQDLDMLFVAPLTDIHQALVRAALLDSGDWFRFLVASPVVPAAQPGAPGLRFEVQCLVDGRPFEAFHLDVGWGDPVVEPPDKLTLPSLLGFAGFSPVTALCYPVTQHIAEKVHAYTRPHVTGESSRVKDLLDILLIARVGAIDGRALSRAVQATFEARGTHALPHDLPDAPDSWSTPFSKMARDVGLSEIHLAVAMDMVRGFLDPVLEGHAQGQWDAARWEWR
jgi:hypothetical protein